MIYVFIMITFGLLIVVEIFTVLFRMTGLSEKRARFQVISMLTAVGYTTKESESILTHSVRRKLAQIVILLGYTSSATLISIFVNLYTYKVDIQDVYMVAIYSLGILMISRIRFIKKGFDSIIEHIADRFINRSGSNKLHVISHFNGNILAELTLFRRVSVLGIPLERSNLKCKNIQILNIQRKGFNISNPRGEDKINLLDRILVYGDEKHIKETFIGILPTASD